MSLLLLSVSNTIFRSGTFILAEISDDSMPGGIHNNIALRLKCFIPATQFERVVIETASGCGRHKIQPDKFEKHTNKNFFNFMVRITVAANPLDTPI